MKKMQQAAPQFTTDSDGQQLAHVALANSQRRATLYAEDYQRLMRAGFSPHWQYTEDGRGGAYVTLSAYTCRGHNRVVPVARLITGAGRGERVRARDGNTLNLRNENLTFFAGAAWFNAADWYPTAAAARAAGVEVELRKTPEAVTDSAHPSGTSAAARGADAPHVGRGDGRIERARMSSDRLKKYTADFRGVSINSKARVFPPCLPVIAWPVA